MSNALTQLRIFLSFPSDMAVYIESAKQVISASNPRWERDRSLTLRVLTFADIPSTYNPSGNQDTINKEFFGKFEIYSGFMGARFGSPTSGYGSGTEEEYKLAIQSYEQTGRPKFIMFGFCEAPTNPFGLDLPQLASVLAFRKDIRPKQLEYQWVDDVTFKEKFYAQLDSLLFKFASNASNFVSGGARYT